MEGKLIVTEAARSKEERHLEEQEEIEIAAKRLLKMREMRFNVGKFSPICKGGAITATGTDTPDRGERTTHEGVARYDFCKRRRANEAMSPSIYLEGMRGFGS